MTAPSPMIHHESVSTQVPPKSNPCITPRSRVNSLMEIYDDGIENFCFCQSHPKTAFRQSDALIRKYISAPTAVNEQKRPKSTRCNG